MALRHLPLLALTLREEDKPGVHDIIYGALRLLLDPAKWAKGVFLARDHLGRETSALHRNAQSWTLLGALRRSSDDLGFPEIGWSARLQAAVDLVEQGIPAGQPDTLLTFNNAPWTEHVDVVRLLTSVLDRMEDDATRHDGPQAEAAQAGTPSLVLPENAQPEVSDAPPRAA